MREFKDQTIGGTVEDSQGECLPLKALKDFASHCEGRRLPLGQGHDLSLKNAGYIENVRVIEHPEIPGEHALVADISCDESNLEVSLKGFSISYLEVLKRPDKQSDVIAYIPFPHYYDEPFMESLLNQTPPVTVGKWVKKSAGLTTVALIGATFVFFAKPVWDDFYKTQLAPKLYGFIKRNYNSFKERDITANVVQVIDIEGHQIQIFLVPDKSNEDLCFLPQYLDQSMKEVHLLLFKEEDPKRIERVHLHFESEEAGYRIHRVDDISGNSEYHA